VGGRVCVGGVLVVLMLMLEEGRQGGDERASCGCVICVDRAAYV
jgi:hypothetical protein